MPGGCWDAGGAVGCSGSSSMGQDDEGNCVPMGHREDRGVGSSMPVWDGACGKQCPWVCGIRSKQMHAPCVWQGLGPKKIEPVGKSQKQILGCPQGDGELLGHGDGAAELRGLARPRGYLLRKWRVQPCSLAGHLSRLAPWAHPSHGSPRRTLSTPLSPNELLIIKLLTEGKVNRIFG